MEWDLGLNRRTAVAFGQPTLLPPKNFYSGTGEGVEGSKSKNPLRVTFVSQNDDFTRGSTSNVRHWGVLRE